MIVRQKIDKALEVFLVVITSILVLDVLWQVISRYVLTSPSSFTDELAGFLLIWVGVLGSAYVAGKKEHLAIDILLQKSGPSRKHFLTIVINTCILLFAMFIMVIGGTWLVYTRFALEVRSAALEIPLGGVYLVLPVSGLLFMYYAFDDIMLELKKNN